MRITYGSPRPLRSLTSDRDRPLHSPSYPTRPFAASCVLRSASSRSALQKHSKACPASSSCAACAR
jgi:hypothetical protein